MKMQVELDWDTVDNITTESLKSHYKIITDMIEDEKRIVDIEYNKKLSEALKTVLDYYGVEV